ncbi:hypothetical protein NBE98_10765 [Clostridium swellfunianum]|nr:LDCC motif putative metal-binding protein [Clostridium swellfunianum]MCM0648857.1 hypothetical protein [Clostridium swellfunianum]
MFKSLKKFLKKLEEANEKSFGNNGKLDCCGMNKPNNFNKKVENKESK